MANSIKNLREMMEQQVIMYKDLKKLVDKHPEVEVSEEEKASINVYFDFIGKPWEDLLKFIKAVEEKEVNASNQKPKKVEKTKAKAVPVSPAQKPTDDEEDWSFLED